MSCEKCFKKYDIVFSTVLILFLLSILIWVAKICKFFNGTPPFWIMLITLMMVTFIAFILAKISNKRELADTYHFKCGNESHKD